MNPGGDTSPELWSAVWRLADAWSQTPVVEEIGATLPRNRPLDERGDKASGITALMQHLDVCAGMVMKPLMYASRIPALLDQPFITGFGMPAVDQDKLDEWLSLARKMERAHQVTLGWLRSSLAGSSLPACTSRRRRLQCRGSSARTRRVLQNLTGLPCK